MARNVVHPLAYSLSVHGGTAKLASAVQMVVQFCSNGKRVTWQKLLIPGNLCVCTVESPWHLRAMYAYAGALCSTIRLPTAELFRTAWSRLIIWTSALSGRATA